MDQAGEDGQTALITAAAHGEKECLQLLSQEGLPIVPRGAGTGLAGGATPHEGGVVFKTSRMRRVIEVSERDRFARVEAGVVNIDLTRACSHHGLRYDGTRTD